jgi:predicted dehydrogenase
MTKKLKIGIVGCGTIADIHAQAIRESGNAELHSVFSRSIENTKRCGEKYDVKWFTEWDKFIADPELDAVSVCTPSGNHLDYGEKAANAGKHVIVEKPIEVTLERANRLITKCKTNGVKLAVIYQSRFTTEMEELKSQLDNNTIGSVFMADANIKWFRNQEYYDSGVWRGTFKLDGGGVLINQAIHTIDLLQWFLGDVDTVYGRTGTFTHKNIEGEDNAVAVLRFKNGALATIEASTSVVPAQPRKIEIHGEKGSVEIIDNAVKITLDGESGNAGSGEEKESSGADSPLAGFSIEPHKKQFEAIVDAINSDTEPPVSGSESIKSLAIVLAVYKSSESGAVINMDEFKPTESS